MSINKGIIKKYTQALYNIAEKADDINQVSDRLHGIRNILKSIPELNQVQKEKSKGLLESMVC